MCGSCGWATAGSGGHAIPAPPFLPRSPLPPLLSRTVVGRHHPVPASHSPALRTPATPVTPHAHTQPHLCPLEDALVAHQHKGDAAKAQSRLRHDIEGVREEREKPCEASAMGDMEGGERAEGTGGWLSGPHIARIHTAHRACNSLAKASRGKGKGEWGSARQQCSGSRHAWP